MQKLADLTFPTLASKEYKSRISSLQMKLMKFQHAIYKHRMRAVLAVEGTDAAGKGGTIKRLIDYMDPRGVRVYRIGAPTVEEAANHYLQRFWKRLPEAGEIAIFDRTWYGRVLVERVEKLSHEHAWKRAYGEINEFEKMLVDDGIILIKLFLVINKEEQRKRLLSRLKHPEKCWKITPEDFKSREYWDDYQVAYQDMLDRTYTEHAPWHIVPANSKKYARIETMEIVIRRLGEMIDLTQVRLIDPELREYALQILKKKQKS